MNLEQLRNGKYRENIILILLFMLFFRTGLGYAHDASQNSFKIIGGDNESSLSGYCGLIKADQLESDRTIGYCPVCHALSLSDNALQNLELGRLQLSPIYQSKFVIADSGDVFNNSELNFLHRARPPPSRLFG